MYVCQQFVLHSKGNQESLGYLTKLILQEGISILVINLITPGTVWSDTGRVIEIDLGLPVALQDGSNED